MSKVHPAGSVTFDGNPTPDVNQNAYKLYYRDLALDNSNDTPLTYDDTFVGNLSAVDDGTGTLKVTYDLSLLPGGPRNDKVRFAMTDTDNVGNESDMSDSIDVTFDTDAPAPPTNPVFTPAP